MNACMRGTAAVTTGLCLALAGSAFVLGQREARRVAVIAESRTTSTLLKAKVALRGGESIGTVTDFVISEDGCLEYMIVTYEERYVLVPWRVVRLDYEQRTVVINTTLSAFKSAPTFTKDRWSSISDSAFIGKVNTAFGVQGRSGVRTRDNGDRDDDARPGKTAKRKGARKAAADDDDEARPSKSAKRKGAKKAERDADDDADRPMKKSKRAKSPPDDGDADDDEAEQPRKKATKAKERRSKQQEEPRKLPRGVRPNGDEN